jgi:hypothetical protein
VDGATLIRAVGWSGVLDDVRQGVRTADVGTTPVRAPATVLSNDRHSITDAVIHFRRPDDYEVVTENASPAHDPLRAREPSTMSDVCLRLLLCEQGADVLT